MLHINAGEGDEGDISGMAGVATAMGATAMLGPLAAEGELAELPVAWEEIAPTWHHIFPQAEEFAPYWRNAGINIDEYLAQLPRDIHIEQLHGPGNPPIPGAGGNGGLWNACWREFFRPYRLKGTTPSRDEIFEFGRFLLEKFEVYSYIDLRP
jgi:hypothetical protein